MLRKRQLYIDYQRVFESPEGKRVLADLRKRAGLLTDSLNTVNGVDVNKVLVEAGRADVVKHIYRMLRTDPNEERVAVAKNRMDVIKIAGE